tara:strand:- start:1824 stop:2384 length:561 start_codon:yes stop_codon:yes gene_type:complete
MSRQKTNVRLNDTDFYPTPPWCYENLNIDWSKFTTAHEPCAGDGRIVNFLQSKNINCSYSEIMEDKDFFDWNDTVDLIFTNPPFSLAKEFIDHSLAHSNTVFMLLRLNFLGSIKRHEWWINNPPTSLFVFSKRPSFTGTGTDATDYAWFVWDKTLIINKGIFFVEPASKEQSKIANDLAKKALLKT